MPGHRLGINDKEHVMSQNLISLELSDEDIAAINAALTEIETRLAGRLIALDALARRRLTKVEDRCQPK